MVPEPPEKGHFPGQITWIWSPVGPKAGGIRGKSKDGSGSTQVLYSKENLGPLSPMADLNCLGCWYHKTSGHFFGPRRVLAESDDNKLDQEIGLTIQGIEAQMRPHLRRS